MPEGITVHEPTTALASWQSEPLSDEAKKLFFAAAIERRESALADSKKMRNQGMVAVVIASLAVMVMSVGCLVVYTKTPVPPPPGYIIVDTRDALITRPYTADEIPAHFPEVIRDRAVRDFITACETYVPSTFLRVEWHNCMIMATPEEQKVLASEIGPHGSRDPAMIFTGTGGPQATIDSFTEIKKTGEQGINPNQTFSYQVRYVRLEILNGKQAHVHYTGQVHFQFHPELKMTSQDRLVNTYGTQVVSYSTTKD